MFLEDLEIGQSDSFQKTVTESDVYSFAGITGDMNPFHINEEFCKTTKFGKRLIHGALLNGMVSAVLGMKLPGPGTIFVRQEIKFLAPAFIGDTIKATVTVANITEKRVFLKFDCTNQDGIVVCEGESEVSVPRKKK